MCSWDFGDGLSSAEPNSTHTYEAEGNYRAEVTVTDAADHTAMASVSVTVERATKPPGPPFVPGGGGG